MTKNNEKIDFVVLWVNPNDKEWQKERRKYAAELRSYDSVDNTEARYRDWGLFKYWFRGVEEYAPWVNKVHLVTCGHIPEWLNINHPKLNIVKHSDFMPKKALPTFNSNAIELCVHKIPGLAEQFVLFNDDTFILKPIKPTDFFKKGIPVNSMVFFAIAPSFNGQSFHKVVANDVAIINKHFDYKKMKRKEFKKCVSLRQREWIVFSAPMLLYRQFIGFRDFHIPNSYLKSTFRNVWENEPQLLSNTVMSRFRNNESNINHWLFNYWQFASGNFEQRNAHFGKSIKINDAIAENAVKRHRYHIVCLNDNDEDCDYGAVRAKILRAMDCILPGKSSYEK